MTERFAIALDVGGMSIKSAIVSESGKIVDDSVRRTSVNSKGTFEQIINPFLNLFTSAFQLAQDQKLKIAGIGIGMPGPFDYENGISLIQGVDKYEAIYDVNLKDEFQKELRLPPDFPILFENDAWAFVRGEAWQGAARRFNRIIGVTLGTGMGSGFLADDEILEQGPGIPALAWIGGRKYKSGILDDRISSRGIIEAYRNLIRREERDLAVKDIAKRAEAGDKRALNVFEETGSIMGHYLIWHAQQFQADCVVIGGQIAKAFHFFGPALQQVFVNENMTTVITQAQNIENSAMLGASRFLFKRLKNK